MESFLSRDNVDMLIEILLDDKPSKTQSDINQIIQELNVFRNTHINASSPKTTLLELNQTFLKRMVQGQQQQQQSQPQYQQQQPHQEQQYQQQQVTKYKVEDLKAERMDFFDQQLAQKRNEFEAAITLKKPAVPTFEDSRLLDEPISDMETLMAKTLAQRNLDIPFVAAKPSDWLSPANTSVRAEKTENKQVTLDINEIYEQPTSKYEQPTSKYEQPTSKYEQPTQSSKKISWSEEPTTLPSIFSKLKQTQTPSLEAQIETLTNRISALESKLEQLTI
jgi:hypothetical protein